MQMFVYVLQLTLYSHPGVDRIWSCSSKFKQITTKMEISLNISYVFYLGIIK